MRSPRQARAKATVNDIIDAGFISVARHQLGGTTTRHIADIAGISVGTLYEYFPNKEAVFAAMHARLVTDTVALIGSLTPRVVALEIRPAVRLILTELASLLQENDGRYLRYAQCAQELASPLNFDPVAKSLQELVMQYLFHHAELVGIGNLPVMSYILVHGSVAVVVRHLSEATPPIPFEGLIEGLGDMIGHYAEGEMARAGRAKR